MQNVSKGFLFVFFLIVLFSCKKPVGEKNTAFYGKWEYFSEDGLRKETFLIVNDSLSVYSKCIKNSALVNCCKQEICFDCTPKSTGEALVRGKYLFIGEDGKFKIEKEPYVEKLYWLMQVDGKTFVGRKVESCEDLYKNGNETGVDCGGCDCNPCPTCGDGIKNQGEQEVDCGGSACNSCFTKAEFELSFNTQNNYLLKAAKSVKATNKGDSLKISITTNDLENNILVLNFLPFEQPTGESFFAANSTLGKYKLSSGKVKLLEYKKTAKNVSGTFTITLEYSYWTGGTEGNGDFITDYAFIKNGVFETVKY